MGRGKVRDSMLCQKASVLCLAPTRNPRVLSLDLYPQTWAVLGRACGPPFP